MCLNPGKLPTESVCLGLCLSLCVGQPRSGANRVMVESGDAGGQFNDSPRPDTYKPVCAYPALRCTHTI